jgi:predicted permease
LNDLTLPLPVPVRFQISADWTLVLYAVALTAAAAILSGIVPAWQATKAGLTPGLKMEEPQYGHRRFTIRNALIVAQVATTTTLLAVALLFTRSLVRVQTTNPGFDLQSTAWAKVSVLSDRYPKDGVFRFATGALETATAVPGVRSAALARVVPFNGFMRHGTPVQTENEQQKIEYFVNSVSTAYFETMGIPLREGRTFSAADRRGAPDVVIVNEALAARLFGQSPAVGRRIWFGDSKEGAGTEIVGVVGNSKHLTAGETQAFAVYHSIYRTTPDNTEINVIVRTAASPERVVPDLRNALSALDDTAAVDVGPLRTRLAFAYLPSQIGAVLIGSLGALGLILALIGIYGAMAFAVSRRTSEIGIRIALGASTSQVLRNVLGTPVAAMSLGLLIGLGVAAGVAQLVMSFLAGGIHPLDPITWIAVLAISLGTGLLAAILPARRALSVDPLSALRVE